MSILSRRELCRTARQSVSPAATGFSRSASGYILNSALPSGAHECVQYAARTMEDHRACTPFHWGTGTMQNRSFTLLACGAGVILACALAQAATGTVSKAD